MIIRQSTFSYVFFAVAAAVTTTTTSAFVVPTCDGAGRRSMNSAVEAQYNKNNNRYSHQSPFILYADENGGGDGGTENGGASSSASAATDNNKDGQGLPAGGVDDILNSPAFLKRKLEVLKADIEKAQESLADAEQRLVVAKEEWGPQLDDLQREYSNIQERMSNQRQSGDTQAIVTVVRAVLELLDNFDRAYGVIKPSSEAEQAIEAEYKVAYQQILDTFAKLGVKEVDTVGKEFDYEFHQAVMQMPGTDFEEGIVCQEFQKGFLMGQESSSGEDGEDDGPTLTLIRPAMVAVAA